MSSRDPRNTPPLPGSPARTNYKIIKWALAIAALLVAALLLRAVLIGFESWTGPKGLLAGVVFGTLPVPLYLALALWIDRYEKEPAWMLAAVFIWGAAVASFFSFILSPHISNPPSGICFEEAGDTYFNFKVVHAPVVEEGLKGLALFILYWWKKDEFDGVIDGIVYAAMVGLGFAMTENILLYGSAFAADELADIFVARGILFPFVHPLFTAMTGIGLGLARQSDRVSVKIVAPLAGLVAAMALHSLWNYSGGRSSDLRLLLFIAPMVLGVLAVVFFALYREGRLVRHYLTPELKSGLLGRQEYDSLSSVSGRLHISFDALREGGFGAWRARRRLNQAASELAFHRHRVRRGITSSEDAEREAACVRILGEAKGSTSVR